MAVQMELCRIIISDYADQQIIELQEVNGERKFPIVIGLVEATAINRRLTGQAAPRPQTHDLLANVIETLGANLTRIEITDLSHSTFFASILIQQGGKIHEIDSRPSDAIAIGIANSVPIFVAEHVLDAVAGSSGK